MAELPVKAVIVLATMLGVLVIVSLLLLSAASQPFDARKTFAQGCLVYCAEIRDEAASAGERLEIAAVRKAQSLAGTQFMEACGIFYPETRGSEYLCWNRECCGFQLPPP